MVGKWIKSLEFDEVEFSVTELLSQNELINEGKNMRHCVASYMRLCSGGGKAIFSIRKSRTFGAEKTLATIEVDLRLMSIVQARARCNAQISEEASIIMRKWAKRENIEIRSVL